MTDIETAYFAGGCFWCMEYAFDHSEGIVSTVPGYGGGDLPNPNYMNHTGHKEMIEVKYDPSKISYEKILDIFWINIDPTDNSGQFFDRGESYTTAIYFVDEQQKKIAENSKNKLSSSGRFNTPIVTEILPFKNFFIAEDYHQKYYKKNPVRYNAYKAGSQRDLFKKEHWKK